MCTKMTGTSLSSDGFPSLQYSQGMKYPIPNYTSIPPKFWNFLDLPSLHPAPLSYSFVTSRNSRGAMTVSVPSLARCGAPVTGASRKAMPRGPSPEGGLVDNPTIGPRVYRYMFTSIYILYIYITMNRVCDNYS